MGGTEQSVLSEHLTDEEALNYFTGLGFKLVKKFEHPTFGGLILGEYRTKQGRNRYVYLKEQLVDSQHEGEQLFKYCLWQEQQENVAFLRVISHIIKRVEVILSYREYVLLQV